VLFLLIAKGWCAEEEESYIVLEGTEVIINQTAVSRDETIAASLKKTELPVPETINSSSPEEIKQEINKQLSTQDVESALHNVLRSFETQRSKNEEKTEKFSSEAIKISFEDALKKVEEEKAMEQARLSTELKNKLNDALEEWIYQKEKNKRSELNRLIDQSWENLPEFGPRFHYNYYLRNYSYKVVTSDVIRMESVITPYKGFAKITETLIAEKEHAPSVSYPEKYFYTAVTPLTVHFEYRNRKFVASETEHDRTTLTQGR